MRFIPVQTRRPLLPPKDDIYAALRAALPRLREGDVLFITSKVLAIHQGRCVKMAPGVSKKRLIKKEAEAHIPRRLLLFRDTPLTIKGRALMPSAGIDESNGNGYYVLWPKRIAVLLRELRQYLRKRYGIKKLAIVATDSHTTPLRMGVTGISIGSCGMEPIRDCRGSPDIFGRKLKYTKVNVVDSLAAMAVFLMGEGRERTPFVILRGAEQVIFTDSPYSRRKLLVSAGKDIYTPLLRIFIPN